MSYTPHDILSAVCCCYQIMEFFVKTEIKLGCTAVLSQTHCQLFFLVCVYFFSVNHPKPQRRLLLHRSPWPWLTMVTWICDQAAIPHKDKLLTAFRLLAHTSNTYHWLSASLKWGTFRCSANFTAKMERTNNNAHTWCAAGGIAQNFGCSPPQIRGTKTEYGESETQYL